MLLDFKPFYTPKQMLSGGVFEGKYFGAIRHEFPSEWFVNARISSVAHPLLNKWGVKSRMSLSMWQRMGWIEPIDPEGWAAWYFRYTLGRRCYDDARQIRRWRGMVRHEAQLMLAGGDLSKRRRQRQTCFQWARNDTPDIVLKPPDLFGV